MVFEINTEAYQKSYGETMEVDEKINCTKYIIIPFWFDLDTLTIHSGNSHEKNLLEQKIPYPLITRLDAQKAYIEVLNDRKLKSIFHNLNDGAYWNTFWKYFDDGGQKLHDFEMFEDYYHIKAIVNWCNENYIPYYINKKDKFIKKVFEYVEYE